MLALNLLASYDLYNINNHYSLQLKVCAKRIAVFGGQTFQLWLQLHDQVLHSFVESIDSDKYQLNGFDNANIPCDFLRCWISFCSFYSMSVCTYLEVGCTCQHTYFVLLLYMYILPQSYARYT